jgi:ferredoxin
MLGGAIVLSALDQSIASIAAQVQTGQLSSVRLVSEALNRIRFHNGSLNCFTRILESEALSDAARVDRQIASGINPGVLSGVPFACKGGVCCTCKAKLVEGKVDMEVNYALEKEQVEAGYILTCQAIPLTETIVVDFDQ